MSLGSVDAAWIVPVDEGPSQIDRGRRVPEFREYRVDGC